MPHRLVSAALLILVIAGCTTPSSGPEATATSDAEQPPAAQATATDRSTAPLLDGIGPLHFPISSDKPLVQTYFDQGLTLAFGFNHAEAVRSFREATRRDPTCAICFWGEALALGPNINAPMGEQAIVPAWAAMQNALRLRPGASQREQAYIDAIAARYSEDGEDRATLDLTYAGAMAGLVQKYPDDLHARTLYAEALMDLMPWEYWQDDGSPTNEHTTRLVAELEQVMAADPEHVGALHLYIHAMERFEPEKAVVAADTLGGLVPVAGHLVHMPSHIYLRVGRYEDAVNSNARAAEADEDYIAQCNAQGLYPAAYYPHNVHFLWYAAMMEGRKQLALDSATKLTARVPQEMAKVMGPLQSYLAVPVYTYVRFGMWDELLALPEPAHDLPFLQAMHLYGQGMAQAALGEIVAAQATLAELETLGESDTLKALTMRRPGAIEDLIGIARSLISARIARSNGDAEEELAKLAHAVEHQDNLPYTEPPLWHYPVRQSLGDAQMRAGQPTEAITTFEQDLVQFPHNPWSLYGLEMALGATAQNNQSVVERRAHAWRNADIQPTVGW